MITLDITKALKGANKGYSLISKSKLQKMLKNQGESAKTELILMKQRGEIGFLDVPFDEQVNQFDAGFDYDSVVVCGIGGSSLGMQTVHEYVGEAKKKNIYFLENIDSHTIHNVLSRINIRKTAFFFISKSGRTVETLSQWYIVRDKLKSELKFDWKKRVFFITDSRGGYFREICEKEGITGFEIPSNVGGRYSVLTNVGKVPSIAAGIEFQKIVKGAQKITDHFLSSHPDENLPVILSILLYNLYDAGYSIHCLMPYSDRLRKFSLWFTQLFGESLGKAGLGPTPLPMVGTVDQHSLLQLLSEGPLNKTVIFIEPLTKDFDFKIPESSDTPYKFFKGGKDVFDVLIAEKKATEMALLEKGVPSVTIGFDGHSLENLGALFQLFMITTALFGITMGVNPFNQDGVEKTKLYIHGILGVPGFEEFSNLYKTNLSYIKKDEVVFKID